MAIFSKGAVHMTHPSLWKKYPKLERLWNEYIRVCHDRNSTLADVSSTFGCYEREFTTCRERHIEKPVQEVR